MIHKKPIYIYIYILITIALVNCEPDKVLYTVIPQKAKIIESSFKKKAVFLKWNVKKLKEEKVAAYGISYGIVNGKTIKKREVVPKFMEAEGFTIRKLKEGTQYWFKVQAIYEEFAGPWSEKAEGTTGKPQPPVNFTVEKNTKAAKWFVNVSWENNPLNDERKLNIEEYRVKCWDSNNPKNKYEKTFSSPTKVSTQGVLETSGKVNYVCSVQVKTDKGTLSEVKQSGVLAFDDIEKPAVSKKSERWGTPITITKVADHSYELKQAINGVAFDESTGQVTALQPAARIIIVAKRTGYEGSTESDPIEFTKQAGSTLNFVNIDVPVEYGKSGNTHTQTASNDRAVAGDTGVVAYSISPMGVGASVDTGSGKVVFTLGAIGNTFTITATKAESAKYEAQTASYQLTVQANTNTSDITKPAVSKRSERWGIPITVRKVADHSYTLKQAITGVAFDKNTGQVTATQSATGIIIVAKRTGYAGSVDSDPIEFTRQAGSTLKFANIDVPVEYGKSGNSYTQTASNDRAVAGDTGVVAYSISPTGAGASIDMASGKVGFTLAAIGKTFTITARKAESAKYEAQTASYQLRVQANTNTSDITKPAVNKRSERWGTPIIVRKVADHSYTLKQAITGVAFDESTGQVTATQAAARIIIVAKRTGYAGSVDSDPIEFTRQAGSTLNFVNKNVPVEYGKSGNSYTQTATNDRSVRGDTRNIEYSISPTGAGASINTGSGKVNFALRAIGKTFTITATKAESAKYEAQRASYQLRVRANTNTADITKPAVSKRSESWGTPIKFTKVADHSYTLKQAITGVAFDESTGQVTATQAVRGVIIVAKRTGYAGSTESDPIEFTRQAGSTLNFVNANKNIMYATGGTYTQAASNDRSVRGDTRNIEYSISPMGVGASINAVSGKVNFTPGAIGNTFTITARKAESAKYEEQTASYQLTVAKFKPANKAALKAEITKAIRARGNKVDLNYIDTSQVTDMSKLFQNMRTFNGNISTWNTSRVTNMSEMFDGARAFNQPLNKWKVSRVVKMWRMFADATSFNQPLNKWDVSRVTDMFAMFFGASVFNQPLNKWKVSRVTDMKYMFTNTRSFNQPLNKWDVSRVTDMGSMFSNTRAFNQNISSWADKSGRNIKNMFSDARAMWKSNAPRWAW